MYEKKNASFTVFLKRIVPSLGEQIHADVCDQNSMSLHDIEYFVTFMDDFSKDLLSLEERQDCFTLGLSSK